MWMWKWLLLFFLNLFITLDPGDNNLLLLLLLLLLLYYYASEMELEAFWEE